MIPVRLEQFDFLLCAFKPGCELSKAASKASVKTRRGGSKAPELGSSVAERDGGMGRGAFSQGCLETKETQVVMGIDKATHVREGRSAETHECGWT